MCCIRNSQFDLRAFHIYLLLFNYCSEREKMAHEKCLKPLGVFNLDLWAVFHALFLCIFNDLCECVCVSVNFFFQFPNNYYNGLICTIAQSRNTNPQLEVICVVSKWWRIRGNHGCEPKRNVL